MYLNFGDFEMAEFETVKLNNGVELTLLKGVSHVTLFDNHTYRSWTDNGTKSTYFLGDENMSVFEYMNRWGDNVELVYSRQDEQHNTTHNTNHKQHVLEYVAKWLDGEKIQYKITTTPDDDKQWHNFTQEGFYYIKRNDIHFRIAPKFVELNGITFKSIDSLIKYVKNNYDMNN